MVISLTSSMLLAGTATGLIHVYDVASHQILRTISSHKGMNITYLTTMLRPPDLVGHISLTLSAGGASEAKGSIPVRSVMPFQRIRDAKAREAHEVTLVLPQLRVRPRRSSKLGRLVNTHLCLGNEQFILHLSHRRADKGPRLLCETEHYQP